MTKSNEIKFKKYLKRIILSILVGLLAGFAAAIFLSFLDLVTRYRNYNPELIWLLPFGGFLVGLIYFRYGGRAAGGNNLILEEIHDPKSRLPLRMAPLVLLGTLVTHLLGGSAGREGTAVQMSASLADQLSRFFKVDSEERKILLVAGTGAGFGAAIGAPWAGAIFGLEVIHHGRLRLFAWFECLVASFVGYYTSIFLAAPHSVYPEITITSYDLRTFFFVALAGICFGLAARLFVLLTHLIEHQQAKWINSLPLRPLVGGIIIVILFYLEGTYRFAGLGIPEIQKSILEASSFDLPLLKAVFTALTVGSGFKGGEFIPLVFIGATLGSALSLFLPISFSLLAGLGFAAVFAGAANTPIACAIMAAEIFGPMILPYALLACFVAYLCSGQRGIYKSQLKSPKRKV